MGRMRNPILCWLGKEALSHWGHEENKKSDSMLSGREARSHWDSGKNKNGGAEGCSWLGMLPK